MMLTHIAKSISVNLPFWAGALLLLAKYFQSKYLSSRRNE